MSKPMELRFKNTIRSESITRSEALDRTRAWAKKNIALAYRNPNYNFSILLLLSIIDCFAQAEYEYTTKKTNESIFCDFVLEHAGKYRKDLERICPVTLYYDSFEPDGLFKIQLHDGRLYPYNDNELSIVAQSIIDQMPELKTQKAKKRHQYVHLLYRFRSKLVHELNTLGTPLEFDNIPFVSQGEYSNSDGKKYKMWKLNFPKKYIYELTKQVIYDRLDRCEQQNNLPFPLTLKERRCELSWYDTPY